MLQIRSMPLRLTALATASALALATAPSSWAAPPPIPLRADPPSRVARLARVSGAVSYHTADADHWSPASLNYPISAGDVFWTEPNARADIQLATNRMALAPSTELDVATLDDHVLATSEPQGETYLHLRQVPPGDSYSIQTPRGVMQITATGRYGVVAGDASHPTVLTVIDGSAQVTGPNLSLQIGPRQSATITGSDTLQGSVGPEVQDAFLTAMTAEERPAPRATVAIPPVVQQMTGAEDLDDTGAWRETPEYGSVWYPPVDPGWVPYRHGHWSYVAPWGWTWVDDASWGFAPFHYGRWVQVDDRWGWVPVTPGAVVEEPIYAPALVSFVDLGGAALAGAAVGFGIGALAGRSVGWVPLGPREPYYPPYRANLAYIRNINATNIRNVNQTITNVNVVNNRTVVNNFVNRGGATVVPAAAMVQSSPIAAASRPFAPNQFTRAQAQFRAPVTPGPATAGVTRAVARQFNFVPPAQPAQAVPGPAIRPAAAALRAVPGLRPQAGVGAAAVARPEAAVAARPAVPAVPRSFAAPAMTPVPVPHAAVPRAAIPQRPGPRPEFARPEAARPEFARPPAPRAEFRAPPAQAEPPRPQAVSRPQPPPEFHPRPAEPPRAPPPVRAAPPPAPRPEAAHPRPAPGPRPGEKEEHRP